MKRVWILAVAAAALMLAGCARQEYFDPGENAGIITAEDKEPQTVQPTLQAEPPLTVSGRVKSAQVNGELIDVNMLADGIELDVRINGDTTAVGDIYSLDGSSEITATVAEWQQDDSGYFGTALNVSVDNDTQGANERD